MPLLRATSPLMRIGSCIGCRLPVRIGVGGIHAKRKEFRHFRQS